MPHPLALIAIGGNALIREKEQGLPEQQWENARACAELFAHVLQTGQGLCIVHGNGPQVGNLLIQQEAASNRVPPYGVDIADAMTQGSMGYLLQRSLLNRLRRLGMQTPVTTVLTEVVVDREDPGFEQPTKPIGPFYQEFRAMDLMRQKGWRMKEDSGRGWRKVVPSPHPLEIVQVEAVQRLLEAGHCVIAGGGGGIPLIREASGDLVGVEAVVDKDHVSSLLARQLGAHTFTILTGVDRVALDFGKPTQRWVERMTAAEARKHLAEGQFPPGSMGPKIQAALAFLEGGGREVRITSPTALQREPSPSVGTRMVAEKDSAPTL